MRHRGKCITLIQASFGLQTLFELTVPNKGETVDVLDLGGANEELAGEATAPSEERASADPNGDAAEVIGEWKTSMADGENADTSDAETSSKLEVTMSRHGPLTATNDQPIKKKKKKLKKDATADNMAARIAHQKERVSNVLKGKVNR